MNEPQEIGYSHDLMKNSRVSNTPRNTDIGIIFSYHMLNGIFHPGEKMMILFNIAKTSQLSA